MDRVGCHYSKCDGEMVECIGGKKLYVTGNIPKYEKDVGRLHIRICNKCNYVDQHSAWFS